MTCDMEMKCFDCKRRATAFFYWSHKADPKSTRVLGARCRKHEPPRPSLNNLLDAFTIEKISKEEYLVALIHES